MASAADVIVAGLIEAGVPRLFGVPGGGSSLEVLESARAAGLPFVLCHLESAAVIMAAVTAELTGRPGAALATLGPGVTASATGLAHAWLDRAPLVFLSDRHPGAAMPFVTHQRLDHEAFLGPVVKASLPVTAATAAACVSEAIAVALAEPRGPVHLDLPSDVAPAPAAAAAPAARPAAAATAPVASEDVLERAAALIRQARRPIAIAGLGCRGTDAKWLRAFAESVPTPVLTTYKAKGALPDPHPLAMGVFTGGALEEPLVGRADLIIAIGLDTVELIPQAWRYSAPVLSLGRASTATPGLAAPGGAGYFTPAAEVIGEPGAILEELAPRLGRRVAADWDVAWLDRVRRERYGALEVAVPGLAPHRLVQIAREAMPAGAIATVDAGAHMFPATAYWLATEPGECLISNGLATMGFALPAAIAAQLCHPDRRVVCLTGDGGLMMVAAEMETAARLALPVIAVVFDDRSLSLIEIKQEQKGYAGASMRYAGPDLVAMARSFGWRAHEVGTEAELGRALSTALSGPVPTLIAAGIDASGYRRTLEIVRGAPAGPTV